MRQSASTKRRAALKEGRALLDRLQADVHPAAGSLEKDLSVLADARAVIISATQRLKASTAQRQAAARALYAVCNDIRGRIKRQFRGPRHEGLHRLFGVGMVAAADKPFLVLALADQILTAVPLHPGELRAAGVGKNRLVSLRHRRQTLAEKATRCACAQERRETVRRLDQVATRVLRLVREPRAIPDACTAAVTPGGAA